MSSLDEISAKAEGDKKEVEELRIGLIICFFYQAMLLATSTGIAFKLMIRYDFGLYLLIPITIGFYALHLGEIGRSLNQTNFLKWYLILSYIAMFLLLAMRIHTLLADFESGVVQYSLTDLLLITRIVAMIHEIAAPIVATRFTLPLIRSLSSSSSSRSM